MSVQGYTQSAIVAEYSQAMSVEYTYVAAITIIVYDSLILFNRELEYIYKGRQTLIKWIYLLIKLTGLAFFVVNLVVYPIPHQTPTLCFMRQWFTGFLFEIVNTAIIKILLVLRLRALYGNNRPVTVLLCLVTAAELISTAYAYVVTGWNMQLFISSPAPIPGCPLRSEENLRHFQSSMVIWTTRLTSNSLESMLLLYGLHQSLKEAGSCFLDGWARIRQAAPTLYVFYRDGTIFYIPLCALSIFGFVAMLMELDDKFTCSNWEAWLGITYYIAGTRLILNIRQAGLKFSTSMLTGQLSTLPYHLDDESTAEGDGTTSKISRTPSNAGCP